MGRVSDRGGLDSGNNGGEGPTAKDSRFPTGAHGEKRVRCCCCCVDEEERTDNEMTSDFSTATGGDEEDEARFRLFCLIKVVSEAWILGGKSRAKSDGGSWLAGMVEG